ncbi:uncharacterized protein EV422DRAFT_516998 [Fimicolochytrium jonesii]|uniref:uncharacterized protein n=1 Tax=Fimicolochytrium jonesii TaxID=1396493 RepID=UPI0022FEDA1A|nr:uncharacterized protein EV422DRAFT_516998 [Fimicolochytrium jonesii]KAI8824984.1 hypothetical protein EV422DRAFT_516998 [Fimicolochytrium jonesii]
MHYNLLKLALAVAAVSPALAAWPYGPFSYTVPFAKGGGSASIAELQAPFIPGSKLVYNAANSGAAAWANMKNDPKDGSVVTLINLPHTMLQPIYPGFVANYTFDDIKIAYIHSYTPLALIVPSNSTIQTWADFVDACRTGNSSMIISGAAKGTVFDLATLRLKRLARLDVAYESAGDGANVAITALLQGKYRAAWTTTPAVFNRPDLRTLAIAAEFEFPQIDAPTFKELGINYVDGIYRGMGLPAGTPDNVMQVNLLIRIQRKCSPRTMYAETSHL